jgi:hypothetical protein
MFCPTCGSEERQRSQFCRSCGTDLRGVRTGLEKPDAVTASAVSARDEIGHAMAARIAELRSASDLKRVAEDVLPQIEKFLESPEERRLRRMRGGVITAAAGLGGIVFFLFMGLVVDKGVLPVAAAGLAAFLVGLGIVLNGLLFSMTRKEIPKNSAEAPVENDMDELPAAQDLTRDAALLGGPIYSGSSITDQTTHHLSDRILPSPTEE